MAWRFAIGGALAWVVLAFRPGPRRALRALPRRTLLGAIGLGVLYVTNTATYYAGLETMPLGLSALIVYLYPPIVAVLALRLGPPARGPTRVVRARDRGARRGPRGRAASTPTRRPRCRASC